MVLNKLRAIAAYAFIAFSFAAPLFLLTNHQNSLLKAGKFVSQNFPIAPTALVFSEPYFFSHFKIVLGYDDGTTSDYDSRIPDVKLFRHYVTIDRVYYYMLTRPMLIQSPKLRNKLTQYLFCKTDFWDPISKGRKLIKIRYETLPPFPERFTPFQYELDCHAQI